MEYIGKVTLFHTPIANPQQTLSWTIERKSKLCLLIATLLFAALLLVAALLRLAAKQSERHLCPLCSRKRNRTKSISNTTRRSNLANQWSI